MKRDTWLDHRHIRRHADRAAASYEHHDVLQRAIEEELLARLDFYLDKPRVVADVGAGTGRGSAELKQRFPRAEVLALDVSLPMLQRSRQHQRFRRRFDRVAGDAMRLPLADNTLDVLYANFCFPWCDDLPLLFAECMRVLKPGGFLAFSTHGPDTLSELRHAWAQVDDLPHAGRFLDMHDLGDIGLQAGLHDPVLDASRYTLTYATPRAALDELKGLGATNADTERRRTLTGKARYHAMLEAYEAQRSDGRIPATFEVVTGHAWAPQPDQTTRIPGVGDVTPFSADTLRKAPH